MNYRLTSLALFHNPATGGTERFEVGTSGQQVPDADLTYAERDCLKRTQRKIEPAKAVAIRLGGKVRIMTVGPDVAADLQGALALPRRAEPGFARRGAGIPRPEAG